ncbi:MAG: heat shock protein HspQ, partial [Candidatus Paceibacteria bacterium]
MQVPQAQFNIGQVVQHKHYGFRGVVFDVDFEYSLDEQWYQEACKAMASMGQPPIEKKQPFYHLLTDGSEHESYVSQQNLCAAEDVAPVQHAGLDAFFTLSNCQ